MDARYDYRWAKDQLRGGVTRETLCPECSHKRQARNKGKRSFGLSVIDPDRKGRARIAYKCLNCEIEGAITEGWDEPQRKDDVQRANGSVIPMRKPDERETNMARWATDIWAESVDPHGTLAERYWTARFGSYGTPFPPTVRFNPHCHHEGSTQPAVVAAFGVPPCKVVSIQRTMLKPDGSGHAGKFALGAHKGLPMVVHRNAESRGLVIAEGMEKALAAAFALNVDGWAAAGLHFLEDLGEVVPADTECVTIIVDQGAQALEASTKLILVLNRRGIDYRAVRLTEDPDDILRKHGLDALRLAIDATGSVVNLETRPEVGPRLLSEAQALALRQPQDWLIEGILEKGYLYALTARSGSGKTAFALLVSYLLAAQDFFPRILGGKEVEPGNVVYLAGENPVDTIRRMAGLRGYYKLEAQARLAVVMGRFSIKDKFEAIAAQIPKDRLLSLVVVDTSAFFFEGEEENSNAAMIAHASVMRKLTQLPGNPAVMVLCHPAKFAKESDDLIPRGGSSFYNEIDANLTLAPGEGEAVFTLGHTKLRGPDFQKLQVELVSYTDDTFVDTKGRPSSTVVARILSDIEADAAADAASETERKILDCLNFTPEGMTNRQLAEASGMLKGTVSKVVTKLMQRRPPLVEKDGSLIKMVKVSKGGGNKRKHTETGD